MPPSLDFKSLVMSKSFFGRSNNDDTQIGGEKPGDLTITTIIGITVGSLLFILLLLGFLVVARARLRKANAPISPEDEFAKASFARWQSNMAGRPYLHPHAQQHQLQHQQHSLQLQSQRWPASMPRRTTSRSASASASWPRTSSISSLSSDEKTWVDDDADLEVDQQRRFFHIAYGAASSGSGGRPSSRSSRIDLPSALPRAHIPR